MVLWRRLGRRRSIGLVVGVVIIALVGLAVRQFSAPLARASQQTKAKARPAVPVTAAVAVRQDVPNIISTIGTVQAIDTVAVVPQITGPIVKIEFKPGENVKKGQELFLIDPRPFQAALDQVKAQLAHDQSVLAQARLDLNRYQTLAQQNSIAKQTAEDQVFIVGQDEGTVAVDQANVDTAEINLGYCHIKSPIDGRAGVLQVDLGNVVSPLSGAQSLSASASTTTAAAGGNLGTTAGANGLVAVTQIKPIYVSFPVAQTQLDQVKQRQADGELDVDAYLQSGEFIEQGKLTVIDNQVNTSSGTVSMQATFANPKELLWPGEFVRVELTTSVRRNVVTVPANAVMLGPNGSYVYIVGPDQKVHRTDVEVAARRHGIDVIGKGVADGDKVVTDGQYRLADGAAVDVRQTTEAGVAQR
jgi:membrane fusion protein, multidrug efflux system